MSVEISRSLEEIDNKVKVLNKTLKESGSETRELDKALKLDPKNVEASDKKMKALQTSVGTAVQKVALLKQKQDESSKAFAKGDMTASEFKKIELAVLKAENEVSKLNSEIAKTQKLELEKIGASFDNITNKLKKAQSIANTFSKIATGLVVSIGAAATAFAVTGSELDVVSKKFKISAEELQLNRNLYQKATGDASSYDSALSSLSKAMTNIAKGSGASYQDTLTKLGVSVTDNTGKQKSLAAVYSELTSALGNIADENERATLSSILFGESGLAVSEVASLNKTEISEYNTALIENGLISTENAEKAREVSDAMDGIKHQLQSTTAEIMVALMPTILSLMEFVKTTILPILTKIASWFANMSPAQQKLVFFLLMLVIIVPKVIAIISAIIGIVKAITIASYGAAGGIGSVSAASLPLQPILLAVAAAILVVVLLFAILSGKSKDVTSQLKSQQEAFSGMQSQYDDMSNDMDGTVAMTSSNSNTNTLNYDVNINAYGDTPISQEAADLVADNLADRINASLGGKI